MKQQIAFVTKNRLNPAYSGALVGAQKSGAVFGFDVRGVIPTLIDDPQEQSALLINAIADKPAAIILHPAHEVAVNDAIKEVAAAKIPLFVIVSKPTADSWVGYISSDHVQMAHRLGLHLLDYIGGAGDVVVMDGHPGAISTPERHRGFLRAITERPKVKLLETICGDFQQEPAYRATLDLLERHPKIDGMLIANDSMAMGVIAALDEKKRKFPLVSINGTPEAVDAMKSGLLIGTAYFNTLAFGKLAVEAAARHLRGETIPREILLPAEIIKPDNIASWDLPYDQRPVPAWEDVIRHSARR